jgi:hypothetical protein
MRTALICARADVQTRDGQVRRLELMLRQRNRTVDALRSKLEQERAAKLRLDAECERLCEMVRLSP